MIIEVNKNNEVAFCNLDYGEVFGYGEDIYMVMPSITTLEEDTCNAIDLSSGYIEYFPPGTKVIPYPKAKLFIED